MIDIVRDQRQEQGYRRWVIGSVVDGVKKQGVGTLIAPTGYGKTTYAVKARRDIDDSKVMHVVVPRIPLKEQWEAKQLPNVEVKTIQWILSNMWWLKEPCECLVIDEVHLFAAEQFSKIFEKKHRFLMSLTASLERMDGKHKLIEQYAPVVDEVPYDLAVRQGWVEDVQEFNIAVPMKPQEATAHQQLTDHIRNLSKRFTAYDLSPTEIYQLTKMGPAVQRFAQKSGLPTGEIMKLANMWRNQVNKRKNLIYNAPSKLPVALEIHKMVTPKKTIFFGQSILFAEWLYEAIGSDTSVIYHSDIQSRELPVLVTKEYKTLAGAMRFQEKYPDWKYRKLGDKHVLAKNEMQLFGKARLKKMYLEWIADNSTPFNTLISAKALEVGLDIQDLEYGICSSVNSNPTSYYQKRGRIGRVITDEQIENKEKRPFLINLVSTIPNGVTQDQKWLSNAQGPNIPTLDGIEELKEEIFGEEVSDTEQLTA